MSGRMLLVFTVVLLGAMSAFAGVTRYTGTQGDTDHLIKFWPNSGGEYGECSFTLAANPDPNPTNETTLAPSADPGQPMYVAGGSQQSSLPSLAGWGSLYFELVEPLPEGTQGLLFWEFNVSAPEWVAKATIWAGIGDGTVEFKIWDDTYTSVVYEDSAEEAGVIGVMVAVDTTNITVSTDTGSGYNQAFQVAWSSLSLADNAAAADWRPWTSIRNITDITVEINEVVWDGGDVPNWNGVGCDATSGGEGEGEGEPEPECWEQNFDMLDGSWTVFSQSVADTWGSWATPEQMKFADYPDSDLDADGIPDSYAMALLAHAMCDNPTIQAIFDANLAEYETQWGGLWDGAHGTMGLASISQAGIDWLMANYYMDAFTMTAYTLAKSASEPLSADGDYDGDGYTNLEEYQFIAAQGGSAADYGIAASGGFAGPGVPVAGIAGLAMLAAVCGLTGFRLGRKK